jgi:hypothetical protein
VGTKVPEVTSSASVIVPCGKVMLVRDAQGRASAGSPESAIAVATTPIALPKVSKWEVYSEEVFLETRAAGMECAEKGFPRHLGARPRWRIVNY